VLQVNNIEVCYLGVIQVLQQAVSVRALAPERAREFALSLAKGGTDAPLPPGAVGRWLRSTLLPGACPGQASADACLVRLVSGEGWPGGGTRVRY